MDAIRETLGNDEQKVGADIVKRALGYPLKLIANNAGVNGSVVMQKVLDSGDERIGYNAAIGERADVDFRGEVCGAAAFAPPGA